VSAEVKAVAFGLGAELLQSRCAAYGRGQRDPATLQTLQRLNAEAQEIGFHQSQRALDAALAEAQARPDQAVPG